MKKILLIIIVAILCSIKCDAQRLKYGFRFGINSSTLELTGLQIGGENNYDGEDQEGIVLGGFAEYRIKAWGFATELLYSSQGAKFNSRDNGEQGIIGHVDLNYISLSPIVKLYIFKWLNIQLGWHFNYNAFGHNTLNANIINPQFSNDPDSPNYNTEPNYIPYKASIRKLNQGLVTGIEICIQDKILFTHRSFLVNTQITDTPIRGFDLNNCISQFSFGYKF